MPDVRVRLGYEYNKAGADAFLADTQSMQKAVAAMRGGGVTTPAASTEATQVTQAHTQAVKALTQEDKNWDKVNEDVNLGLAEGTQKRESEIGMIQREINRKRELAAVDKIAVDAQKAMLSGQNLTPEQSAAAGISGEWQAKAQAKADQAALKELEAQGKAKLVVEQQTDRLRLQQMREFAAEQKRVEGLNYEAFKQTEQLKKEEMDSSYRDQKAINKNAIEEFKLGEKEKEAAIKSFAKQAGAEYAEDLKKKKIQENSWRDLSRAMFAVTIAGFSLQNAMRMVEVAFGEKLPPAIRSATDGLMFAAGIGASMAMVGLPVVAVAAGTVAAGLFSLGVNAMTSSQEVQDLNKQLDSFAKKDDLQKTLSIQLNLTDAQSRALFELASKYPKLAAATRDLSQEIVKSGLQRILEDIGSAARWATEGIGMFFSIAAGGRAGETLDVVGTGRGQETQEISRLDEQRALRDTIFEEEKKLQKALDDEYSKGEEQRSEAFNDAVDNRLRGYAEYGDQVRRLGRENAQAEADFQFQQKQRDESRRDEDMRRERQFADDLARSREQRDNRMADISRDYQQRELDDAWDYRNKLIDLDRDRIKARQDLADNLMKIERRLNEDLMDLDFDTAERLRGAKTERDREDILYSALYDRSKIFRRASDERSDLRTSAEREEAAREQKRRDEEADYQHRRAIAMRERGDQESDTRRSYEEERVWAEKRNQDQIADTVQRRQQEDEASARQYEQMKARQAQTLEDLKTNLQKQFKSYDEAYNNIDARVTKSYEHFKATEEAKLEVLVGSLRKQAGLGLPPERNKEGTRGFQAEGGYQMGGVVPGPVGKPRWVLAHGGEEVTPIGGGTGQKRSSPQYVAISVEPVLGPAVSRMMQQLLRSNAFRESVRILVNDEVVRG